MDAAKPEPERHLQQTAQGGGVSAPTFEHAEKNQSLGSRPEEDSSPDPYPEKDLSPDTRARDPATSLHYGVYELPATASETKVYAEKRPASSLEGQSEAGAGRRSSRPEDPSPNLHHGVFELPATLSGTGADEEKQHPAPSLAGRAAASAGPPLPPKVSFPSKRSSAQPIDGQFGVVSTDGKLVCEFQTGDVPRPSPPPEEKIVQSSPPEPPSPTTLGGHPPSPLGLDRTGDDAAAAAVAVSTVPEHRPASTPRLPVDRDSYPEVYVPWDERGPRLPPRASPPANRESLASSSTAAARGSGAGYRENGAMSMGPPPPPAVDAPMVTPLHRLGEQADHVDCPFCLRRVETVVKKRPSTMTHVVGVACFFGTLFGLVVPYCCRWFYDVEHYCRNCNRRVAQRTYGDKHFEPLGTHPGFREVSRFESAEIPSNKSGRP